jgi:hypothetical protein
MHSILAPVTAHIYVNMTMKRIPCTEASYPPQFYRTVENFLTHAPLRLLKTIGIQHRALFVIYFSWTKKYTLIKVKKQSNSAAIDIANKLYKIATSLVVFMEPWGIE